MFCIYCGKEIPEGSECSCRKQPYQDNSVSANAPLTQTPDTNPYNNFNYYGAPQYSGPAMPYQDSRPQISKKHQAVKDVFRSPLTLITCVLFSADFVLGLLDGFSMDVILLLSTVGLWLIYAFSHKAEAPLKPAGLTFHSVILIIQRVFLIMLYAIVSVMIISLAFIPDELNEFIREMQYYMSINYNWDFNYTFSFTPIVFSILFIVWTCFFLFMLFYNISLRNNVRCLIDTTKSVETRRSFSTFPGVAMILKFLLSAGSAITYFFTADARSRFTNSFLNSLLRQIEDSADIKFNYTFNLAANYITPARIAVSAAAMLLSAIIVFSLKAKMKQAENE